MNRYSLKSVDDITSRPQPRRRKFAWKVVGFTACSKSCGGGTQTPIIKCVRENPYRVFNLKRCTHLKQPQLHENMMKCNTQPCPAYWKIFEWGDCHCGGSGAEKEFRVREVKCVQELMPGIVIQHNSIVCNDDEPRKREECDCNTLRKPESNRSKPESILNRPSVHRGKNRKKIEVEMKRSGIWLKSSWSEQVNRFRLSYRIVIIR